jgi:hypothetical protein
LRRRSEVWSVGFDDGLQLIGGDQGLTPNWSGLLVPDFAAFPFYLFLTAAVDLEQGDEVFGIRQYLELGAPFFGGAGSTPPVSTQVLEVTTPMWHGFPDGFAMWILTFDGGKRGMRYGPFDGPPAGPVSTFKFEDSDGPALVYESATIPPMGVATRPGYLGLTAYAPPLILGVSQIALRDVRFAWRLEPVYSMRLVVNARTRVRLYCLLKQTDTSGESTRFIPSIPTASWQGLCPEDRFVQATIAAGSAPRYNRVGGAIITDKSLERMTDVQLVKVER